MDTNCTVVTPDGQHIRGRLGNWFNYNWFDVAISPEDAETFLGYQNLFGAKTEIHFPISPTLIIPDDTIQSICVLKDTQPILDRVLNGLNLESMEYETLPVDQVRWYQEV